MYQGNEQCIHTFEISRPQCRACTGQERSCPTYAVSQKEKQVEEKTSLFEYGACQFCGQAIFLQKPADTPEQANALATRQCDCKAAQAARYADEEKKIISELFADDALPEVVDLMMTVAELTRGGKLESGSVLKLDGVTAKVKMKDGVVSILRTQKSEHQRSLGVPAT